MLADEGRRSPPSRRQQAVLRDSSMQVITLRKAALTEAIIKAMLCNIVWRMCKAVVD